MFGPQIPGLRLDFAVLLQMCIELYGKTQDYRRYDKTLKDFCLRLEIQQCEFRLYIKAILKGITTDKLLDDLIQDPKNPQWDDHDWNEDLRKHLGDEEFRICKAIFKSTWDTLEEISQILRNNPQLPDDSKLSLRDTLLHGRRGIRFCFGFQPENLEKLLHKLQNENNLLGRVVDRKSSPILGGRAQVTGLLGLPGPGFPGPGFPGLGYPGPGFREPRFLVPRFLVPRFLEPRHHFQYPPSQQYQPVPVPVPGLPGPGYPRRISPNTSDGQPSSNHIMERGCRKKFPTYRNANLNPENANPEWTISDLRTMMKDTSVIKDDTLVIKDTLPVEEPLFEFEYATDKKTPRGFYNFNYQRPLDEKMRNWLPVLETPKHQRSSKVTTSTTATNTHQTLKDILSKSENIVLRNAVELYMRDRLEIAAALALSVSQLHKVPWLQRNWRSQDIGFFSEAQKGLDLTSPYLSVPSLLQTSAPEGGTTEGNDIFPPIGARSHHQQIYGLGLILLELGVGKVLEDSEIGRGVVAMSPERKEYMMAQELIMDLGRCMGHNYAQVVRTCLSCDFNATEVDLTQREMQEEYFLKVIDPLDSLVLRCPKRKV